MSEILRLFQSAIDPADLERLRQLFADDVAPAFTALDGCLSIELVMSCEQNAGGLVEGAAISRWTSRQAMDAGVDSRPAREGMVRILQILRQEPVTRVFEVVG